MIGDIASAQVIGKLSCWYLYHMKVRYRKSVQGNTPIWLDDWTHPGLGILKLILFYYFAQNISNKADSLM